MADQDPRYFGPYDPQPIWAPPVAPPPQPPNRRRTGLGILVAAFLLALVVGGAAGFGGARLAAVTEASSAPTDPSTDLSTPPSASEAPPTPATAPRSAPAPDPNRPASIDTVEVAKAVLPGTVMIRAGGSGAQATGSGFVLDPAGRILTNNHVVARAADGGRITVTFADGRRVNATLVGRSPSYDVAVIKVAPGAYLKPIALGDSDASQVGEPVVAVGSPLGLAGSVTQGIISAKNRPVVVQAGTEADAPSAYINGIQTDAPINPGNSGGPLIDSRSRVIGVNSAILTLSSQESTGNIGLGFAIPIKQAAQIGNLLIKNGKASYPVIGANVGDEASGGVRLKSIERNGPAAKAGLREGDVVSSIDRQPVSTLSELIVAVRTHRPGEKVTLAYTRGTERGRAVVTLGGRDG